MLSRSLVALSLLASLFGFAFTATSTSDFAKHLDRQVHALHCSFVPGAEAHADDGAEPAGCRVALMSPYSSVARREYWGGIPVSLPGVPTFAFLAAWSVFLLAYAGRLSRWSAVWAIGWWTLPVAASIFMGRIALVELQAACKMCIGTYAASAIGWLASVGLLVHLWLSGSGARRFQTDDDEADTDDSYRDEPNRDGPGRPDSLRTDSLRDDSYRDGPQRSDRYRLEPDDDADERYDFDSARIDSGRAPARDVRGDESGFDSGFAFDDDGPARRPAGARPASAHRPSAHGSEPPRRSNLGRGGAPLSPLAHAWSAPVAGLALVAALGAWIRSVPDISEFEEGCGELALTDDTYEVMVSLSEGPVDAIEILDPLCAACRAFEERLEVSGLGESLGRRALLFPLDAECNWMIGASLHPGACAVSEAILCDAERADAILEWAFARQDELMDAERARAGAVAGRVMEAFPSTRGCVGSPEARSAVHRGLRWAVQNELPIMTPQLFVGGRKLCNEDTDLGLDYMLTRLIERASTGAGQ